MKNKNITLINNYNKNGFVIIDFLKKNEIEHLEKLIKLKIEKLANKKIGINKWKLQFYHKYFDKNFHKNVVSRNSRYIKLNNDLVKKILRNKAYKEITKDNWGHSKGLIKWIGSSLLDPVINHASGFRIARNSNLFFNDFADPHIDIHYGGIIRNDLNSHVTFWTPITGFSKKYTLKLFPGTHLINHSISQISKQTKKISRVFNNSYVNKFKSKRLNLKKGQAILFHPNLIHGGSLNEGRITRTSIEFRIYNKVNYKK